MKIKLKVVNSMNEIFFVEIPRSIEINAAFLACMESIFGEISDTSTLSTIGVSVI